MRPAFALSSHRHVRPHAPCIRTPRPSNTLRIRTYVYIPPGFRTVTLPEPLLQAQPCPGPARMHNMLGSSMNARVRVRWGLKLHEHPVPLPQSSSIPVRPLADPLSLLELLQYTDDVSHNFGSKHWLCSHIAHAGAPPLRAAQMDHHSSAT